MSVAFSLRVLPWVRRAPYRTVHTVSLAVAFLLAAASLHPAHAQLISPGKLTSAHSALEGIRNCTQCHELRKPGISPDLCLACHEPLARRIEEGLGYHATVADQGCASCHKEHLGPDFRMVRLDTLTFRHADTGFELEGAHDTASCRGCHTADHVVDLEVRSFKEEHGALDRTFLGLSRECVTCHEGDDPHRGQFQERSCAGCHDARSWEGAAGFDHDAAAFRLTGRHGDVTCAECHTAAVPPEGGDPVVRYTQLAFGTCADCHRDPHDGGMPGTCSGCHTTAGWRDLDRRRLEATFNHRATGFPLEGRHATAPCASCHDPRAAAALAGIHVTWVDDPAGKAYPPPEASGCISCHDDEHGDALPDACEGCHTAASWREVDAAGLAERFDHASTGYPLEGRHAQAPCASCHDAEAAASLEGIAIRFAPESLEGVFPRPTGDLDGCLACHTQRHGPGFTSRPDGGACASCHGAEAWLPARFDVVRHNRETDFVLEGAHVAVACVDCHEAGAEPPTFQLPDASCASCHADRDPHGDQFAGRDCASCHGSGAFRIPGFDHDATRFPLDGAHQEASCQDCHTPQRDADGVTRIRYRPLGTECRDCHGGSS